MKRRDIFRALFAAPLLAVLPKALPFKQVARVATIDPVAFAHAALESCDQSSIWLVNWGGDFPPREFTGPYAKWQRRMWLKRKIA